MDRFRDASALAEILGEWAAGDGPLYRKLAAALRRVIRGGEVPPGSRLPSERDLAKLLSVSRATVVAAYDLLRADDWVASRRGGGTRVLPTLRPGKPARTSYVPSGWATSIISRQGADPGGEAISLALDVDAAAPEFNAAALSVLADELSGALSGTGCHPVGYPPLREAIADHFTGQGVPTLAGQILVTTGVRQSVGLVAQMYLGPGAAAVVETPSWPGCLDLLRAAGARLEPVPLDGEGVRVDELARACLRSGAQLAYVMPAYNSSAGTLMSRIRRSQLADLAAKSGIAVVEDHTYAGFASGAAAEPPPVAAFAPADSEILTMGSLEKSVWAGLSVGWIRGPVHVIDRLARYKARADLCGSVLDQAIAARLVPQLREVVAGRAAVVRRRRLHLDDLLRKHLPDWEWQTPAGGAALWIALPGTDARVFAQVASRHGLEIIPGGMADPTGAHDNYFRLPCTFSEEVSREIVARLHRSWCEVRAARQRRAEVGRTPAFVPR